MCALFKLRCRTCNHETPFFIVGPERHNFYFITNTTPVCIHFEPGRAFFFAAQVFWDPQIVSRLSFDCPTNCTIIHIPY